MTLAFHCREQRGLRAVRSPIMTAGSFSPVDASDDFGKSSLEGRMLHEVLPSDEIFIVQLSRLEHKFCAFTAAENLF